MVIEKIHSSNSLLNKLKILIVILPVLSLFIISSGCSQSLTPSETQVDISPVFTSPAPPETNKPDKSAASPDYSAQYENELINKLKHTDPQIRWNAAVNLGIMKSHKAVPYLTEVCRDSNPQVRMLAVWALGKIKNQDAVNIVGEKLTDPNIDVKPFAMWALGEIGGEKAAEILMKSYDKFSEYGNIQIIINSLGKIASPSSLAFLQGKVNDSNLLVSINAIEALGCYQDERATDTLITQLKSKDPGKVIHAIYALKKQRAKKALPELKMMSNYPDSSIKNEARRAVDLIEGGKQKESDNYTDELTYREECLEKNTLPSINVPDLKMMNPEDITNFGVLPMKAAEKFDLESALRDLKSGNRSLIYDAVWRMGNSGDKRTVPVLTAVLDKGGDRGLIWNAAKALGKLKDRRAVPSLLRILNEKNPDVREDVAQALGRIGDKSAMEPLLTLLGKEQESFVISETVIAIGKIKPDEKELEQVKKLLNHSSHIIRANVLLVIGATGRVSDMELLMRYHGDSSPIVREASNRAVQAIKRLKKIDLEDYYHEL